MLVEDARKDCNKWFERKEKEFFLLIAARDVAAV